jgi:hypothetical protein
MLTAISTPIASVRVSRTAEGLELYFPPLRMPEVALPLAVFGVIAMTLPAIAIAALLPSLHGASGVVSAVLIGSFALPFGIFGAAFVGLAVYMLANALIVRIGGGSVTTARVFCGVVVRRQAIACADVASLDAEIASRYQSLFSREPVYQLVARDRRGKRVVVAETLKGETLMTQVKALFETEGVRAHQRENGK